jgi:hypothetical protein
MTERDIELWERLVAAHLGLTRASRDFMMPGVDRVEVIRHALSNGFDHAAGWVLEFLPQADLMALFPVLLKFSIYSQSPVELFRSRIRALPREWVLARLDEALPEILDAGDCDVWRRVLELCSGLDLGVTLVLAEKASASADPDTREAGEEFREYVLKKQAGA